MQVKNNFFSENFSTYVASEQAIVVCALVGPFLRPQGSTRPQLSNASQREVFKKFSARPLANLFPTRLKSSPVRRNACVAALIRESLFDGND